MISYDELHNEVTIMKFHLNKINWLLIIMSAVLFNVSSVSAKGVPNIPPVIIDGGCNPKTDTDCLHPQCPPYCLDEVKLTLTDKHGRKHKTHGNKRTIQRKLVHFINTSGLNRQEKVQAKKQIRAVLAALVATGTGTHQAKKPEVTIHCDGGPTTSPTGGTGGTAKCGFTIKFGGGKK
jgi:hypothetical protein